MTRQVQNPLTCASPPDEVSEVAASSQRRDTALQRTASSLNLYKIIGDSSSEIVWEQASAPNADCIFPVIPALPAPTSASPSKKLTKRFTPTISRCSVPTLIRSIPESKTLFRAVSAPLAATGAGFPWMSAPAACATTIGRPFTLSAALRASPTFLPSPPLSRHPAIPSYPTLSGNVSFPGAASPFPTVWNASSAIRATTSGAWRTLSACFTPVILPSSTNA